MVVCLTSARMNMLADVVKQGSAVIDPNTNEPTGYYDNQQDPDSGEIIRVWVPKIIDNPDTPEDETQYETFKCLARGIIDGGIRVAGTTERFGDLYDGVDYVRIWFPPNVVLSRRDRITNIRDSRGNVLWKEDERPDGKPTVFSVNGTTPIIDPFGRHTENVALLERVEAQ